jgi:hypothetical protein
VTVGCSRTPDMSPPPVGVAAGLHQTAEGGASAAPAAAGSHFAEPLAPASWELGVVAGNLLVQPATRSSCHLEIEIPSLLP